MIEVRNLAVSTNALPIYTFQNDGVFALISAFAASNHMTNGCTCAFVFSFEHFGNFTRFCLTWKVYSIFLENGVAFEFPFKINYSDS